MKPDRSPIIDISTPLRDGLAGWPGDTPYRFALAWSKARGATVNVGRFEASIHTGTHVDAPFHFDDAGATVDALDLAPFLGPCAVLDVAGRDPIRIEDLARAPLAAAPRILLRTGGWPDRSRFPEAIPTLAPDVPEYLRGRGVVLIGLDVPSVDPIDSKGLPIHHALAGSGIAILEAVDLEGVAEGVYELIALPLRLGGADGSPVRAILRRLPADAGGVAIGRSIG